MRRINIFGRPGSGKSTIAMWLAAELKMSFAGRRRIEYVDEYVKAWAYEGRKPGGLDQIYFLGKQLRREERLLSSGIDVIVTDSPVLMGAAYADEEVAEVVLKVAAIHERAFPSLNIMLFPVGIPYDSCGRFQSEEEAVEMERRITKTLDRSGVKVVVIRTTNRAMILDYGSSACEWSRLLGE